MRPRRYRSTLDRLGWSIAAAALAGGVASAVIAVFGHDPGGGGVAGAGVAFAGGAVVALLATVAIGLPLWIWLRRRADGPLAAALLGLAVGWLLLIVGQTGGFGAALPTMDGGTLLMRWASAALTATVLAPLAALVALVAWRVAHRRMDAIDGAPADAGVPAAPAIAAGRTG